MGYLVSQQDRQMRRAQRAKTIDKLALLLLLYAMRILPPVAKGWVKRSRLVMCWGGYAER